MTQNQGDHQGGGPEAQEAAISLADIGGLPVGLFLFDARSGRCLIASEQARAASGLAAQALAGAELTWLFPELSAEDVEARLAPGAAPERFETMLRSAEAGYRKVSLRLSRMALAQRDVIAAAFDEPERPLSNSGALTENDAVFQAILASTPDALVVIDVDGSIVHVSSSAERLFGYAEGEMIGRNVSILMRRADAERHDGHIARYLRTGEKRIIGVGRRVEARRKDGMVFPVALAVGEAVIGERRLFTGFVRDISTRVAAEQRAQELGAQLTHLSRVAAVGETAAAIAHEISQPLTAVANYAQAAARYLERDGKTAEAREAMQKAAVQVARASEIVRRTRGFMKLQNNARAPFDMNVAVREAVEMAMLNAGEKRLNVEFRLAPGLPKVDGEASQIQQVVVNLLRNAIDALASAPERDEAHRIVIETKLLVTDQNEPHVAVAIHDTGPGVTETELSRIFAPFVTTKTGGLGLGLSICRSIIDAHGGALRAERSIEGGAAFTFTLPIDEPEDDATQDVKQHEGAP